MNDLQPTAKKRRRGVTVLRRVGVTALALVLLLAAVGWFLLGTEPGARWLFTRVGAALAGSLEVGDLEGPIRGPLTVHDLVYRADGLEVHIERLSLDWRLRELLRKRLDIVDLTAENVDVLLAEGDEQEPTALPDVHLPINIVVRGAQVRDIEIVPAEGEPLVIDSIDLVTRALGETVEIERLSVRSPELSADVSGQLVPIGDYSVDLETGWSAEFADLPRLAGSGTLTGTLAELQVRQRLEEPFTAELDAALEQPLRDLAFEATADASPFSLRLFGADLPAANIGATVHAEGTVENLRATGKLSADSQDHGPLRADLAIGRDGERWTIDRLLLTTPANATRVTVSGQLTLPEEQQPAFDLQAEWSELEWPLTGEAVVRSPEGRAAAAGDLAAYDLEASAVIAAGALPPTPVEIRGQGSSERLALGAFVAELLGGVATASGEVAWAPQVEWRLAVDGRDLDPSIAWPEATGSLNLEARTSGRLEQSSPDAETLAYGTVDPLRLTGTLRGEPIEASGTVTLAGERITVDGFGVDWASLELAAGGRVAPTFDFTFDLEAPNLALALSGAGGSLSAEGRLSGPQKTPRVELRANAEGLVWNELSSASANLEADLDLAPQGDLHLDLEATDLVAGERSFDRLTLEGDGSRGSHQIGLEIAAEDGSLDLRAEGGLIDEQTWRGALKTLDLTLPEAGSWSLAEPATVRASASEVEIERLCEVSGQSRLCVGGTWQSEAGWRTNADFQTLPLSLIASFLPPDLEIRGTASGEVDASAGSDGLISADAAIALEAGQVIYPVASGETETLRFGPGTLDAQAGASGLQAQLELPLPDLGEARAELALPGYRLQGAPADEQPIEADLRAQIRDLSFLQAFSTQLDATAGTLDADLRLTGTVGRPQISGEARLEEGQVSLPQLGVDLTELQLTAADRGGGSLEIAGSVRSGEGTLEIAGEAPALLGSEDPLRLTITGERFTAMDTPDFRFLASPDLELTYDGELLAISGDVRVPEAEVELENPPEGAVEISDDVVYVGGVQPSPVDSGLPLSLDLRILLGDDVEIDVLGLEAEPTGSLRLVETPGQPVTGTGQIDLEGGTFKAYGQDLTIERGRLIFAGPIDQPRIDIRAFRRAKDGVVAGLEAEGPLDAPRITLWSDPPMDQANQLSYLLLGRPLGESNSSEADLVANAAASLGLKGGNLLAQKLGARFGLEEARIETDGGIEEASLVLGKYLSPRLYVAYGVGLFEAVNTLRLRYLLSSKWTLEATTGVSSGGDIFYTIERGEGAVRKVAEDADPLVVEEVPAGPPAGG